MRVYFPWINNTFHWTEEDPWRYCYNASRLNEMVSIARIFNAHPQTLIALEETTIAVEGNNPMKDKEKRKIFDDPKGEKSCKMMADPIIVKEDLEMKEKKEKRMKILEKRKR